VPATTQYAYGTGSGLGTGNATQTVTYTTQGGNAQNLYNGYNPGYVVSGGNYAVGTTGSHAVGVVGTTVNTGKEVIKGESRIEYVPF